MLAIQLLLLWIIVTTIWAIVNTSSGNRIRVKDQNPPYTWIPAQHHNEPRRQR